MHSLHHHGPLNEGAKRQIRKQLNFFVKKKKSKCLKINSRWCLVVLFLDSFQHFYLINTTLCTVNRIPTRKQLTFRLSGEQWLFLSILDIALKITKKCKWKQRLDNEGSCLFSRVSVSLLSSVHFYSRRKMVSVLWHNKKIISDML